MKSGAKSRKSTAKNRTGRRLSRQTRDISELIQDEALIGKVLSDGVRQAVLAHKLAGRSIVVWRDGKVVHVPAEEIEVDENGDNEKEKRS